MNPPSIKASLKSRIQQRRQARGLDNLVVDFTPKPVQPMSPEEIEKDRRRKTSNKNSAFKSRLKAKQIDENNQRKLAEEKDRRSKLIEKIKEIEKEKKKCVVYLTQLGVSESIIKVVLGAVSSQVADVSPELSKYDDTMEIQMDDALSYVSDAESCSTLSSETTHFQLDAEHSNTSSNSSNSFTGGIITSNVHSEYGSFSENSQDAYVEDVDVLENSGFETLNQACGDENMIFESDENGSPCGTNVQYSHSYLTNSDLIIQGNDPSFFSNQIPHMHQLLTI